MSKETKLRENTEEHIKNAINVLQLLVVSLEDNQDDPFIIRSINIVLRILQTALSDKSQSEEELSMK